METVLDTLGQRLKSKRLERHLKQQDLADAIGVKRAAVSQWESDETKPKGANLLKLCKKLNCDIEWIQTGIASKKEDLYEGLSASAVEAIETIAKLDKTERAKVEAVRTLLGL